MCTTINEVINQSLKCLTPFASESETQALIENMNIEVKAPSWESLEETLETAKRLTRLIETTENSIAETKKWMENSKNEKWFSLTIETRERKIADDTLRKEELVNRLNKVMIEANEILVNLTKNK